MKPIVSVAHKNGQEICFVSAGTAAFVWNPKATDAILVSADLLQDWLEGAAADAQMAKRLDLLLHRRLPRRRTDITFVSLDFDSLRCANSCAYCPLERKKGHPAVFTPATLVECVQSVFPNVSDINVSGPDNRTKHAFLQDNALTTRFASINANINIRHSRHLANLAPNVSLVWGGLLDNFINWADNAAESIAAYIVVERFTKQTKARMLRWLPELPFSALTLEPNFFDDALDPQAFHDFVHDLRTLCAYEISGLWERPLTNVGRRDRRCFCASCSGTAICLHDTGYVSVCGYLPRTARRFSSPDELRATLKKWDAVLDLCAMPEMCSSCDIRGLCQGGCRVVHHQASESAIHMRCDLIIRFFYSWALGQLRDWNRAEQETARGLI